MKEFITGISSDTKLLVCKSIPFMYLNNQLSFLELRLLDTYLSRINPKDARYEKRVIRFSKLELEELLNIKINTTELEEALNNLEKNTFTIIDNKNKEEIEIKLFKNASKRQENGSTAFITLECSEEAHEYIFNLKQYVKYDIREALQFTSKSVYMIYQYIKQNEKKCGWKIRTDELKEILGVEDKYKEFSNFEKVIKNSLKEIEKKTDLKVHYIKHKKYNRVYEIEFNIQWWKEEKPKKTSKKKESTIEVILEKDTDEEFAEIWKNDNYIPFE